MEGKKNYDLANCQSQKKQKTSQTCQNISDANCNAYTYYDAIHTPYAEWIYTNQLLWQYYLSLLDICIYFSVNTMHKI